MVTPQQPELERSGRSAVDPAAAKNDATTVAAPGSTSEKRQSVPEDNRPGHHPAKEQDKPDAAAFAEKLGISSDDFADDE
jgi:hypothetical protein